ncbi:nucleoside hydrolase [Aurantimonas sp. C2-6-R+9]|uniref:nucleoside hydrolase n=1 Tax=unclassified Aurantimonas TaxID=2638230 RepID=UPI002E16F441|nr:MULTISPECIES: nucleoside hydrolase [unclassified Aurantimonas]MEC5293621.1 nucleoside hydrolase [Aurantimonas sp. C2-3-R2]MEC5383407.1 nucleoside hydrolase [Aurantimonas sp. C2-6-R+9]MEC5414579.1 nucleoside hydrolase [Aurantimonas sp. C2-4-R8]
MAEKVIFDTDPGQDDAVAILTALASPDEIDILGIVTVAGNIPLHHTTRNALRLLELAGRTEVPVHAGCERPMLRNLVTAEHVHGPTGLDGPDLPEPTLAARDGHGVDFLIETIRAHPAGTIRLLALGPLTNVALAMTKAPDIAARLKDVVLMGGGCFEAGNITPAAEFNIFVDPEAAAIVFASGAAITVLPLDVTHQMRSTRERIAAFGDLGNRSGAAVAAMLGFSARFDVEKYGWEGAPLHDPCVTAFVLKPEIFTGRSVNVAIETASPLTRGMTVCDYWGVTDRPKNAVWVRSGDADAYFSLLTERIGRLP